MASPTEISNLAISHLGIAKVIGNLTTEHSAEAQKCRIFYEQSVKATLRDGYWPFARKFVTLALIEEDPTEEWAYSYQMPSDCLFFKRILSATRNDTRQSRVPYLVGHGDAGTLIYTDQNEAQAEYVVYVSDTNRYPTDFMMAVSFRLASYIAPALTGGDPFKLGARAYQAYQMEIGMARANSKNEEQVDEEPESEFTRSR